MEVITHDSYNDDIERAKPHTSSPFMMEEGRLYYIEAQHIQRSTEAAINFLKISFWQHIAPFHSWQTKWAGEEKWALMMQYNKREIETQRITFENMPPDAEIRMTHLGIPSAISTGIDGSELAKNIESLLSYHCTYPQSQFYLKQDFEDKSYKLPGQYLNQYQYVEDIQAYCGRRAWNYASTIFSSSSQPIDALQYPYFCFAAMGSGHSGEVRLHVEYKDKKWGDQWNVITLQVWTPTAKEWSYQCVNMVDYLQDEDKSFLADAMTHDSHIRIKYIAFVVTDWKKIFADEIVFSAEEIEIDRKPPAVINDNILLDKVEVESVPGVPNSVDAKLYTYSCPTPEEDFHLLGIKDADVQGLDFNEHGYSNTYEMMMAKAEATKNYLSTAETVVFESASWNDGTINITRQVRGCLLYTSPSTRDT